MRLLRILVVILVAGASLLTVTYESIPAANKQQVHYDVIIVLGNPANPDGTPAPELRERVLEGIREYRAGVGPRLIMTGGAAHNRYVEAHVMAEYAGNQGVPVSAIIEEGQAQNTIENIFYSAQIMNKYGWRSAEIVSSPSHLPRAALILQTFDRVQPALAIDWRTHAAAWPAEYGLLSRFGRYIYEANYCLLLRIRGFPRSRFLPG
jgi:uncharacterized SAM-binding protein YcdF (DUF218 family)